MRYCDFFAGSFAGSVGEEDAPPVEEPLLPPADEPEPLGEAAEPELAPPLAEPEPLGELELEGLLLLDEPPLEGLLALGDEELAPPEAEEPPDFVASLELDGLDGLDAAPLDDDVEPEPDVPPAPDGDEALPLGELVELELEPDEPLLDPPPPLSQAARPNASATAVARMESFMCPPWLG